jgi:hypothetical protein
MGLFQRLFGATRDAITLPHFDAGSKAAEVSTTLLRECIDSGSAGPDEPNRGRLTTPFARGYLFEFSESCIQRFGVFGEIESLTEYLLEGDDISCPSAATGDSAAELGIETTDVPPRYEPSTGNDALIGKRAPMAAADRSVTTIWLHKRLHMKPVKPITH